MDDGNNAQILVHNQILGLANAPGLENEKRTKIMSAQIRLCLPTEFLLHHVDGPDPACVEEETSACSIMACSRGQRSNRLQIESGRGSEEGGRHSSLQHSQEEPSAGILRARVASREALATKV